MAKGQKPVYWTEEIKTEALEQIFERMIEGSSTRDIFRDGPWPGVEKFPAFKTFLEWISKDTELGKQYTYAMEQRAVSLVDEALEIADDNSSDQFIGPKGETMDSRTSVPRSKLRVDTRLWAAERMNPKKFSSRSQSEVTVHTEQPLFNDLD